MKINYLLAASIFGTLAVLIGAFGAHSLKPLLSPEQTNTFHTAVQYHFYHTFALAIIGVLQYIHSNKRLNNAGLMFMLGIILFSGSLYFIACRDILGIDIKFGIITPIGGICFVIGWIFLGMSSSIFQKININ